MSPFLLFVLACIAALGAMAAIGCCIAAYRAIVSPPPQQNVELRCDCGNIIWRVADHYGTSAKLLCQNCGHARLVNLAKARGIPVPSPAEQD